MNLSWRTIPYEGVVVLVLVLVLVLLLVLVLVPCLYPSVLLW